MLYLFLDTNVFLHYRPFDQIKWLEIVKAASVTIVIPPMTIRELNKHKELNPRSHIKDRANMVIKRLYELFEDASRANLREQVDVILEDRDPPILSEYYLNRDVQDDHLIASMIMHKQENPNDRILLGTSDIGLLLCAKARRHNFEVVKIPESQKLVEESDPATKRIKQLEDQLRKAPQLQLTFNNGDIYAKYELHPPRTLDVRSVEQRIEEIKLQYPKMAIADLPLDEEGLLGVANMLRLLESVQSPLNTITPEQISKYNDTLDKYYVAYRSYIEDMLRYKNMNLRTIEIAVMITNDGTEPAEDIDIFMYFPDGFRLVDHDEYPNEPKAPKPPSKPKTQMELFIDPINSINMLTDISDPLNFGRIGPPPNVSSFSIRRTNSYEIEFHIDRVKHHLPENADLLYIIFPSYEAAQSFKIDYKILAGNVPKPVTGELNVVINSTSSKKS